MKKISKLVVTAALSVLVLIAGNSVAGATAITLYNGYLTTGGSPNVSIFDSITGLGTLTLTASGAGNHFSALFVDHEIDETVNTWFNETGSTSAVGAPAGLTWEIDEPTGVYGLAGDIKANFTSGFLDNKIFNGNSSAVDDVSMALGWNYVLSAGETATITFNLSEIAPNSGFYLQQYDPDSDASIFFTSSMRVAGGGTPAVPEPSTILLLGAGLAGMGFYGRRRSKK